MQLNKNQFSNIPSAHLPYFEDFWKLVTQDPKVLSNWPELTNWIIDFSFNFYPILCKIKDLPLILNKTQDVKWMNLFAKINVEDLDSLIVTSIEQGNSINPYLSSSYSNLFNREDTIEEIDAYYENQPLDSNLKLLVATLLEMRPEEDPNVWIFFEQE